MSTAQIPTTTLAYHIGKGTSLEDLTITEDIIPQLCATEVLIKVHAVSLNYRDIVIVSNQYPGPIKPNVIPGSDLAGTIVSVGSDVQGWKVGERVSANFFLDFIHGEPTFESRETALGAPIDGVLTQYKVLPVHSLVRIPDSLTDEEASTLPCAGVTAYNSLMGLRPMKAGDTVLVEGTGGVSIFALQLAAAAGATVIATSSSDAKLQTAKKLGAKYTINYKTHPDWEKEVLRLTNGKGVDYTIEVGGAGTVAKAIKSTRLGGIVAAIGFVAGFENAGNVFVDVLFSSSILRGIPVGSRTQLEDMIRVIEANDIKPCIDKVFDFQDLKGAFRHLQSQKHVGKVVVRVN